MHKVWLCLAALAAAFSVSPVKASDFEKYCNLDGFSAPVRQTVIVLDEEHIYPEAGKGPEPRNATWRRFLGNLLVAADDATLEQAFLPREHISISIARRDGAGIRTVFTGCVPFFSANERNRLRQDSGAKSAFDNFLGIGVVANAKRDMDLFRIRIGDGFREVLQPAALSAENTRGQSKALESSGLVASLKQANLVNLSYGIPRLILYSDLTRFIGEQSDQTKARQFGLDKGKAADLDFKGAEVHVVGMAGAATARQAVTMFFLASHGELVSAVPAPSLPAFAANPMRVFRYQGTVQYPNARFPIRIRVALDQNGTVVNSWVSVQAGSEQFSPFHGVVNCAGNDSCTYEGDDTFSQIWNPGRTTNGAPFIDQSMPFGGARSFKFATKNGAATGTISDAQIRFEGVKDNKLEFTASRQNTAVF